MIIVCESCVLFVSTFMMHIVTVRIFFAMQGFQEFGISATERQGPVAGEEPQSTV